MQTTASEVLARASCGGLIVGLTVCAVPSPAVAQTSRDPPGTKVEAPADPMIQARGFYNEGEYDRAIQTASDALQRAEVRNAAALLLGRAALERYRATANPTDLTRAREALRTVDASALPERDRNDLAIGLGEALYFDELYRPAADIFASMLEQGAQLGLTRRDQVLDWWATATDRHVRQLPPEERAAAYDRLIARMELELVGDATSSAAAYWLAAASYARGHVDRAWDAAVTGYVRAIMAADGGAALRPDLDRLVREGIIPERVRRLPVAGTPDGEQALAGMLAEWDLVKNRWTRD
jgi:hypothetical protein